MQAERRHQGCHDNWEMPGLSTNANSTVGRGGIYTPVVIRFLLGAKMKSHFGFFLRHSKPLVFLLLLLVVVVVVVFPSSPTVPTWVVSELQGLVGV